jgi:hypothetical protein
VDQVLGAGAGRVVISACKRDQRSWYNEHHQHTLFIEQLLAGLAGPPDLPNRRGFIGIFELYEYLYEQVRTGVKRLNPAVDQEPVITIREGVGPFPVALYQGGQGQTAGNLEPGADLQSAPARGAVRTLPTLAAGQDANVAGRDVRQTAASGERSVAAGGDITGGTIVTGDHNVTQHGKYNVRVGQATGMVIGEHNTVRQQFGGAAPAALDRQTEQQIKELLEQLMKEASGTLATGTLPADTALAVASEANAAKKEASEPEAAQTLPGRVRSMADTLRAGGEVIAAAAPLYALVKAVGRLLGISLP